MTSTTDTAINTPAEFAAALTEKFASESEFASKEFSVSPGGVKFIRIVQQTPDHLNGSVHCFVERATGRVFKAASWKAPAKNARYETMSAALAVADLYGRYLYAR
jgi:hypothetical protein